MHCYISADLLASNNHWSSEVYCHKADFVVVVAESIVRIDQLANCFEGLRIQPDPKPLSVGMIENELVIYKPTNVQHMILAPERSHFYADPLPSRTQVEPGDVVVTKHAPVRAALATKAVVGHMIDSNCLIIRGLQLGLAFWTAYCINHPLYLQRLLIGTTLPRVSLRQLRSLAIPRPPADLTELAAAFATNCDDLLANSKSFWDLQNLVEDSVEESLNTLADELHRLEQDTLATGEWFSVLDIHDSLVPLHVLLSHIQGLLHRVLGWVPLTDLLVEEAVLRRRFDELPPRGRYLGLRAGEAELTINEAALAESFNWAFRVFSQPLSDGEVLVSTLVTKPQVIFVDARPVPSIFVSDQWERLRFRETPGAWALILNSKAVQGLQWSRMGSGVMQQFTSAAALRQIWVPEVPLEQRRKWEQALIRHHEFRREQLEKRDRLLAQVHALFNEVHGLPVSHGEVLPRL
jgi:hypothetical protein